MSATARIIPIMEIDNAGPKNGLFAFLNRKMGEMGENIMRKIEDFTDMMFNNKSEILGQFTLALIKTKYGLLLKQEHCDCPICGKSLKVWNPKAERKVETLTGSFTLSRPYFYCRTCGHGFCPLDDALGLAASPKQYDLQNAEAWLATELTYETAEEAFKLCVGDTLSADHIHQTVNKIAEDLDILDICPTKDEISQKIDEIAKGNFRRPVMMLAIDGAHTPTRPEPSPGKGKRGKGEYKETKGFRLYLVGGPEIVHLISWHQIGNDRELAENLVAVRDAGLVPEDRVRLCIIGDGAPRIWNRASEVFPGAKVVLDFWHCSEWLHAAADGQYGKGTEKARQLVEVCQAWLFPNEPDNAVAEPESVKPGSEEARKKIRKVADHIVKHEQKMNYGATKRGGYHIGSGAIESANKFIGHVRLKRPVAWWYIKNANNMLKLGCAKANGTYDQVVKKYIESGRNNRDKKDE